MYDKRYSRSSRALQEGNLTLDVTGTDLTAKIDADTQVRDAELLVNKTHHELNALLGIWPEAQLKLVPSPLPSGLDRQGLDQSLAGLPNRRPDLMALKAGYDSQEAKVYEAVLGQFPSLDVGIVKGQDDTNVHSVGHDTTLSVPIFNGNRGKIAVEKATREQLLQEYQARIDQTQQQVDLLWTNQIMLRRQLNELQETSPNAGADGRGGSKGLCGPKHVFFDVYKYGKHIGKQEVESDRPDSSFVGVGNYPGYLIGQPGWIGPRIERLGLI